jgi:hypothetical protein
LTAEMVCAPLPAPPTGPPPPLSHGYSTRAHLLLSPVPPLRCLPPAPSSSPSLLMAFLSSVPSLLAVRWPSCPPPPPPPPSLRRRDHGHPASNWVEPRMWCCERMQGLLPLVAPWMLTAARHRCCSCVRCRCCPRCRGPLQELLTPSQVSEFEAIFREFDTSGDGLLGVRELGVILRALGLHCTEAEVGCVGRRTACGVLRARCLSRERDKSGPCGGCSVPHMMCMQGL